MTDNATGSRGSIAVSGYGEVVVTPDALRLELAVEAPAIGVADALAAARSTMADLRQAVSGCGVAAADQQTVGLNVWQRHDERTGTPNGYQASEGLGVLLRDPDMVDAVLLAAAEAAGDRLRVGGLSFTVTDPAAARDEARRRALAEAQRAAVVYADAAGRSLGELIGLAEGGPRTFGRRGGVEMMAAKGDFGGGVEPGSQTIGVHVTAEWVLT